MIRSSTGGCMDFTWNSPIRQWHDNVTGSRITIELATGLCYSLIWLNCTQRWMVGSWKYDLFSYIFSTFTIFVLHFWKIYSLNLLLMWIKELLFHKKVLKWMNIMPCSEYEPWTLRLWTMNSSNDRSGCWPQKKKKSACPFPTDLI